MQRTFAILFSIFSVTAVGAESSSASLPRAGEPLGSRLEILQNANEAQESQVLQGKLDEAFVPARKDLPSFGFRADAFWVRLELKNPEAARVERYIDFANPTMDRADVYVLDENRRLLRRTVLGDSRPFDQGRDFRYRNPNVRLEFPPGARRLVYFRIETTGSMKIFLHLRDESNLQSIRLRESVFYALFYGVMAAMIVYNFFLYLRTGGRFGFLHYVIFITTFLMSQLSTNGLAFQLLHPGIPEINLVLNYLSIFLCGFSFLAFTRNFLTLKQIIPGWDRIVRFVSFGGGALMLLGFLGYFGANWRLYVLLANIFAVIVALLAILIGVAARFTGLPQARFFLQAWGGLTVGILLVVPRNMGLIPSSEFVDWGLELGSTWMVLLLSLGLADVINRMRRELVEYSHKLEARVEERTGDLRRSLAEVQELKDRQDGDYFLTAQIMKPLGINRARNGPVQVEVFINQYKKFRFRKWHSQIGGDYCASSEIRLRGRIYTVFINADAMGKSMQGAGGYLVLGSVFSSIVDRTARIVREQEAYPEQWLKQSYLDMSRVFDSFDGSMMASLTMGLIDHDAGLLYLLNGEHPLPVLYRNGKASFIECDENLRRLGSTFGGVVFRISIVPLKQGDVIIAGSDGRDDLRFRDRDGQINQNEFLFLEQVARGKSDLASIYGFLEATGELIDDLSLIRVEYNGDPIRDRRGMTRMRSFRERAKELYKKKDFSACARLCLKIAEYYPEVDYFIYAASVCLRKQGRLQEAADEGERLHLRNPTNTRYAENLEKIYSEMNTQRRRDLSSLSS